MKHGLNLVGISLTDVAIPRDVFPTHHFYFYLYFCLGC